MNDNFDTILEHCIEQMHAGRSIDAVLEDHPQIAGELRPLLEMADGLQALPDPPLVIEDLMRSLSQTVDARPESAQERPRIKSVLPSQSMLLRLAASMALVFALGFGFTAASADTVPGDVLYPVKRFVEKVRLSFSMNDNNEAELRIAFSEERFTEALKKYHRAGVVDDGLFRQMLEEAKLALDEALDLPPEERTKLLSHVGYLTAHQKNVIETVRQNASPEIQRALEPVAEMCGRRMRWMEGVMRDARMAPPACPNCSRSAPAGSGSAYGEERAAPEPARRSYREWMEQCPGWD